MPPDACAPAAREDAAWPGMAQWTRQRWTTQLQWAHERDDIPGRRIALSACVAPHEADAPSANLADAFARAGRLTASPATTTSARPCRPDRAACAARCRMSPAAASATADAGLSRRHRRQHHVIRRWRRHRHRRARQHRLSGAAEPRHRRPFPRARHRQRDQRAASVARAIQAPSSSSIQAASAAPSCCAVASRSRPSTAIFSLSA